MLNNKRILEIAMSQSAIDIVCQPEDFLKTEAVIVDGIIGEGARVYYKEPISCNFVSYGNNVVASVKPEIREEVTEFVGRYEFYHLFETPNALWLNKRITAYDEHMLYEIEGARELYRYDTPLTVENETDALLRAGFVGVEVLSSWGNTYTLKAVKKCRK